MSVELELDLMDDKGERKVSEESISESISRQKNDNKGLRTAPRPRDNQDLDSMVEGVTLVIAQQNARKLSSSNS